MKSDLLSTFARTESVLWQNLLRRSVRLYVALDEPGSNTLEVDAHLRLIEFQLMRRLLQGDASSPAATAQALAIIESAQVKFLSSQTELSELLGELSAQQAATPLLWATLPTSPQPLAASEPLHMKLAPGPCERPFLT